VDGKMNKAGYVLAQSGYEMAGKLLEAGREWDGSCDHGRSRSPKWHVLAARTPGILCAGPLFVRLAFKNTRTQER